LAYNARLANKEQLTLYLRTGKMPNNFETTLPEKIKTSALEVFQDGYLFDFVSTEETDEKVFEGVLVADIKNMIMMLGKGFCLSATNTGWK
jgi:predicted nuclease of restriction endonuclease-like (RecB) superfamily